MPGKNQDEFQQKDPAEEELLSVARPQGSIHVRSHQCPSLSELKVFVAGKFVIGDDRAAKIVLHLATCDFCYARLTKLRSAQRARKSTNAFRRWWFVPVVAALLVLLTALSFWTLHHRMPSVANIDLRNITRGVEPSSSGATIPLSRDVSLINILLPVASTTGKYELGIFRVSDRTSPVLTTSGWADRENGILTLRISCALTTLRAGQYFLGLRKGEGDWAYYPVTVH